MTVIISRDDINRQSFIRRKEGKGSCDNCGHWARFLYTYGVRSDDCNKFGALGRECWYYGRFCGVGCYRHYHGVSK